jgi:surface antigen
MDRIMCASLVKTRTRRVWAGLLVSAALTLVVPPSVDADPPAWAPAHGWRKKHDPDYVGYTGNKWQRDYGVVTGRCDYEAVGAVVGGVVGGAVGARVSNNENRPIAILVGSVIGAIVGANVGRNIQDGDRACIAHSLELVKDNRDVTWTNPHTGASYLLRPYVGYEKDGRICRNFDLHMDLDGRDQASHGAACQSAEGTWQLTS